MTTQPWTFSIPEFDRSDRLRKAREHAGLEQSELASTIGVSRNTVSAAERGVSAPRRHVVMAWAMACGVPVEWIETGRAPHRDDEGPDGGCAARDSNPEPAD
ncbi:helix-turn-helix transcriptional regulator [Cutibacterium sp. WCA-380-WT-3A]|uniref:Helix-turn-helix transcriptional regulator n=1 Tax=Cutibacterium porci TaxID=2605781 RepID=A0A7K0J822_9ACTN|nr:helix-turn-helix transcriptional regulator [Cutibacterium porci]